MNRIAIAMCLVLLAASTWAADAATAPPPARSAAPVLDLQLPMQSYASVLATPAPASSTTATPTDTRVSPAAAAQSQPAASLDDSKPLVWGSLSTGVGYAKGWGSSNWQSANVNATKLFGSPEHPWSVTGSVAGGLGYSHAFGTSQWEGASVQMSKAFGSARHPFIFSMGVSTTHWRTLGNGNWPRNP